MTRAAPSAARATLLLAVLASAPLRAQVARSGPRLALTAGGVGAGQVASGATTTTGPGLLGPSATFTARRSADFRLAARPVLALEGLIPVGRGGWAVVAAVARSTGRGTLTRRDASGSGGPLTVFGESWSYYDDVVAWSGSAGVARLLPLAGAWLADVQLAGTVGRLRAAGDGPCPPMPPSAGQIPTCLSRPTVALTTPGARAGAALTTPAWRGVRARAQLAGDVLLPDGTGLLEAEPNGGPLPSGYSRRQTGRRAHLLPSAALGLALALPR